MRFVIICEILALLVLPYLMAILHKRGVNFEKQMAFALATLFGLLMGSYSLYIRNPETLSPLTRTDWLFAVALFLVSWAFLYPFSRWLIKQWFNK